MTDFRLADGVNLHVIKETKFKTVRLMVRFRERILQENIGKRVLISNLLETTNAVYTSAQAFSRKLSELYGASFTTGVAKKGNQHLLTINMSFVNPKFVNFDTTNEAILFLKQAIFQPDIEENAFNSVIFKREQINLVHYLQSMNDDRAYYASRKLSDLFFEDKNQSLPSVGTIELISQENPAAVLTYYNDLLKSNAIDIFVLGDVDEDEMFKQFSAFDFDNREFAENIFYQQELRQKPVIQTEQKETSQSLLLLGYHLPVSYGDENYIALQIMNGLLGGFAHSKLFTNVREKASLAYSISSTFDSFSGFLKIAAGIDASKFEEARGLILEQLKALQSGAFTEDEIEQTKTMLRNSYFISQDSASNNIELEFVKTLIPERFLDTEAFLKALEKVNPADIQAVASSLALQAQYFMEGENKLSKTLK